MYNQLKSMSGDSPYAGMQQQIADATAGNQQQFEQAKGYAALAAIPAILQGNNALRGLGAGVGAFGTEVAKAADAKSKQDQELMKMNINLADAQRKENLGMAKDSYLLKAEADKNNAASNMYALQAMRFQANAMYQAAKVGAPPKAAAQSPDMQAANAIADSLQANNSNLSRVDAVNQGLKQVFANKQAPVFAAIAGAGDRNAATNASHADIAAAGLQEKVAAGADKAWENATLMNKSVREQLRTATPEQASAIEADFKNRYTASTLAGNRIAAPAPAAAPAAPAQASPANTAIPLPSNRGASNMIHNQVYITRQGNARWDADKQRLYPVASTQ
jgi:hypothetical protein